MSLQMHITQAEKDEQCLVIDAIEYALFICYVCENIAMSNIICLTILCVYIVSQKMYTVWVSNCMVIE